MLVVSCELHVANCPSMLLQFIVNDTKKYNYNGEIEEKLKDMGRPNLVRIRQKQACFPMAFVTTIVQLMLLFIDQYTSVCLPINWIVMYMCQSILKLHFLRYLDDSFSANVLLLHTLLFCRDSLSHLTVMSANLSCRITSSSPLKAQVLCIPKTLCDRALQCYSRNS